MAIINTILSPSVSSIFTFFTKNYITGKAGTQRLDFQAFTNGILAGLVVINGCADDIEPWAAMCIGCIGSITYSIAVRVMEKLKIDDPLEAS